MMHFRCVPGFKSILFHFFHFFLLVAFPVRSTSLQLLNSTNARQYRVVGKRREIVANKLRRRILGTAALYTLPPTHRTRDTLPHTHRTRDTLPHTQAPLPSNRHHRKCGDCLEGKGENYQVCSVQYCVQQLCTVRCTHI